MATDHDSKKFALIALQSALMWLRQGNRNQAAALFSAAKGALMPFHVMEWGSHPDDGNDDCWTGTDHHTLESAQAEFDRLCRDVPPDITHIELVTPDGSTVRCVRAPRRKRDDDNSWRREIAMEAGMLHGIDAYNDERGY